MILPHNNGMGHFSRTGENYRPGQVSNAVSNPFILQYFDEIDDACYIYTGTRTKKCFRTTRFQAI
jgi:hypothetical protein